MQPPQESHQPGKHAKRNLLLLLGVVIGVAAIGVLIFHLTQRHHVAKEREALARTARQGPEVFVDKVKRSQGKHRVTLPGDVRPYRQASIYAKVQGYVGDVSVDKGERVEAGQVLGRIQSPETDQDVIAARQNVILTKRNAIRARKLEPAGVISKQDLDVANANLDVAVATLKQKQDLQGYETLKAPFDGVVTQRYLDPGALVPASPSGVPFVDVTDSARLRVTTFVGQDVATFLKVGDEAEIVQDERPQDVIKAKVTRVADLLDPRTRTMLVEVEVDNQDHKLVPGVFVHVTLEVQAPPLPLVPTEALLVRGDKNVISEIKDGKVHLIPVEPSVNDGQTILLKTPVPEGTVVAINLPSELGEGSPVRAKERPKARDQQPSNGAANGNDKASPKMEQNLAQGQADQKRQAEEQSGKAGRKSEQGMGGSGQAGNGKTIANGGAAAAKSNQGGPPPSGAPFNPGTADGGS